MFKLLEYAGVDCTGSFSQTPILGFATREEAEKELHLRAKENPKYIERSYKEGNKTKYYQFTDAERQELIQYHIDCSEIVEYVCYTESYPKILTTSDPLVDIELKAFITRFHSLMEEIVDWCVNNCKFKKIPYHKEADIKLLLDDMWNYHKGKLEPYVTPRLSNLEPLSKVYAIILLEIKKLLKKDSEKQEEYIVVDEMCGETTKFSDRLEARKHAFNIQGILYQGNKVLADYTSF